MKNIKLTVVLVCMNAVFTFAQKQTFDVVSFSSPKGWQKTQSEGGVQLSINNNKTGAYALAIITKATASDATVNENFNNDWTRFVKSSVQVNGEPTMQNPSAENGWDIISGNANYTDGNNKGLATLLTATGGNQTVSVVLMTNTQQYQNELLAFINSLELKKAEHFTDNNNASSTAGKTSNLAIVGLWCDNLLETNGYANGFPQYSGGYLRREYLFSEDGTYVFRMKNWSTLLKEILFVYETGAYTVQGNQITITPKKGNGEWWSKKDNNTKLWGNRLKDAEPKLEKVNYFFEIKYYSGSQDYALLLNPQKTTERDGTYTGPTSFSYKKLEDGKSIIDNPPGFKTGFENKSLTSSASSPEKNNTGANNTSIAGLWTDYVLETTGYYINNMPQYTSGYLRKEYTFNNDGTYIFRNKQWLTKSLDITFMYETGTYTVKGNQLIITPKSGKAGFWRKKSSTKEWGSLVKSSDYKLEKTTYTFEIIKDPTYGNSILIKSAKPTQRDGGKFNSVDEPYEFKYSFRTLESLVDNPPGWKN